MTPGEIIVAADAVPLLEGRERRSLEVTNTADRPIQVGSHYHFAAVNTGLSFDRRAAWGYRLAIPSGTAVRFEPGVVREVDLVAIVGTRDIPGLRPEFAGLLDERGPEA
ncbi:urease subunit beta [Cryptosporangium arvum]|uniref:Urease, beta subunit n=1 Tax=Cryptosporangium arvum DSM 44712 TaxID=927661 RepID=A0A010ZSJ4_9ACTN|nr:urease subunit beta [Cryptosporangium arvum]EXG80192.1 urease, beta subunit [Cryptosporangium arvum DSM 44712]